MHGTSVLLIELGLIIIGLGMLARIARRLTIPPIPFYLLVGLAFGHGGLAQLPASEDFIRVGAGIGSILLLFMLGLEFSREEFVSSLRSAALPGGVDFALNMAPGFAAGILLGWPVDAAAFLGGITYISSSGVIAKVISDLGRIANRETPVVLSLLVIEDLVMAAYLPVLGALAAQSDVVSGVVSVVVGVGAVMIILTIALRFGGTISRIAFTPSAEVLLLTILGATILLSGVAERVGVSAAVGAFLFGIALSGPAAEQARIVLSPLRDLFSAVFFLFFGLEIDPAQIVNALGAAAALAFVTALTKVATGWWSARRIGIGPRGRLRAGTALIARGEFSILIAGLAVAGAVDRRIGPLAAGYVMILAVAGPLITRVADPLMARRLERRN